MNQVTPTTASPELREIEVDFNDARPDPETRLHHYWRVNLIYLFLLLSVWFAVSFGAGILLVEELNQVKLGGFPLGFWFAQQGAIFVFVGLFWVYVYLINRLDRRHEVAED